MLTQDDMEKLIAWVNSDDHRWGPAFNNALSVAENLRDNVELAKKQIARPEVAKIIKELDARLVDDLFQEWWTKVMKQTNSTSEDLELFAISGVASHVKLVAKSAFGVAFRIAESRE